MEACYATAAKKAGRDEKTTLKVGFEVNVDGWADKVKVSKAGLPGLSGCVNDIIASIRLRDRPDTGTVLAGVRLVFTPR